MSVTVIIPVWNGYPYLTACLDALLCQDYPDLEVIAVDDVSEDGSADLIAARYPAVHLIKMDRNRGFAGACNAGLEAAQGSLLILLNQDTEVQPGWLDALATCYRTQDHVGVIGSKARYPNGRLQHAGGFVNARGDTGHFGVGEPDTGQYDGRRDVDFVTGASFAMSRKAFEKLGGLDEGFGAGYYEDVDWCYRARAAGFRIIYEPASVLIHKETSTSGHEGYASMLRYQRNRLRFVLKHWSTQELREVFLPAELAWLRTLGEGAETFLAAMRGAYHYHLLHRSAIPSYNTGVPFGNEREADVTLQVLTTLRAELLWERSLNAQPVAPVPGGDPHRWLPPEPTAEHAVGEAPPQRGGWRAWVRGVGRGVHALLRRGRAVFSGRQEALDSWTAETVAELGLRQRRLPEVLAALIAQNAREIDALTCEVARLRDLMESDAGTDEGAMDHARSGH